MQRFLRLVSSDVKRETLAFSFQSGSTELAEVLPYEALPSLFGSSVSERSQENEAPGESLVPGYWGSRLNIRQNIGSSPRKLVFAFDCQPFTNARYQKTRGSRTRDKAWQEEP
jgi:hypothetical protein